MNTLALSLVNAPYGRAGELQLCHNQSDQQKIHSRCWLHVDHNFDGSIFDRTSIAAVSAVCYFRATSHAEPVWFTTGGLEERGGRVHGEVEAG